MRNFIGAIGLCLSVVLLPSGVGLAQNAAQDAAQITAEPHLGAETKLPVPRYVSLRAGKVNLRRGPGLDYRIDWVFQRAGLPVRIIDEYGHWRRISDSDDATGWVYHALLTSRRSALVTEPELTFRAAPDDHAAPTAYAEQGVIARLLECAPDWCRLSADGAEGWVRKSAIWGVDPGEVFGG